MPRIALLVLLLLCGLPWPVWSQPVCAQATTGLVACVASRLCSCSYRSASRMTGEPAGYRWDCSLLRPACGEGVADPSIHATPYAIPESIGIDNGRTTIEQNASGELLLPLPTPRPEPSSPRPMPNPTRP